MNWLERDEKGWGLRERFTAWRIIDWTLLQVRFHRIYEPDKPEFYHSHPRHMFSLMLWGRYLEEREGHTPKWRHACSAAWRSRDSYHYAWHPHGRASYSLAFFFGRKLTWNKAPLKH